MINYLYYQSTMVMLIGVQSLDTRLQKEMSSITMLFKKHKKGKPLRKFEKGSTHVMVFENEMVHLPQNASSTTAIALKLHGKDITASMYHDIKHLQIHVLNNSCC